jgi:hypothetical protein
MASQRRPHALPGSDPLLIVRFMAVFYLCLAIVVLAIAAQAAQLADSHGGHLPWPIAQWALTTPLGALAIAVVGGLACGLAIIVISPLNPNILQPVDVTELASDAWPRPPSRWRDPDSRTTADRWLGHGKRQRGLSQFALALAIVLLIGLLAALSATTWYTLTHILYWAPAGCPFYVLQLTIPPMDMGGFTLFVSQVVWIAWVQRRCGVWFRGGVGGVLSGYIRRPGVTPEAAVSALQRYAHARRPLAQVALFATLAAIPLILLLTGCELLSNWLATQWIPG